MKKSDKPTETPAPEPTKLYTVTKGPIKVGAMILGTGHVDLKLTAAQAEILKDNITEQMPTV
jgi:hypothetical protein